MSKNSPCIRCGKERIVAKSWTEYIGASLVTYTTTVCPDPECQKIVDDQLKKRKDKLETIQRESLRRKVENKRNRKTKKKK
ncbi:hypothetical protein HZB96_03540 [Candidatus Gottesmanbacteria bacterium]|nr:hypothetical protein [Candidatus Gottesmanbacteria bacterium]MBI5452500.1 hypothetical protein [Candidatus Gottesmanbacteria bacterium]